MLSSFSSGSSQQPRSIDITLRLFMSADRASDQSVWPLTVDQLSVLDANLPMLTSELDLSRGLLSELVSAGCINTEQMRLVERCAWRAERNGKLIDIISRRSQRHLQHFVDCLHRTQQHRLAALVTRIGGTLPLCCNKHC